RRPPRRPRARERRAAPSPMHAHRRPPTAPQGLAGGLRAGSPGGRLRRPPPDRGTTRVGWSPDSSVRIQGSADGPSAAGRSLGGPPARAGKRAVMYGRPRTPKRERRSQNDGPKESENRPPESGRFSGNA